MEKGVSLLQWFLFTGEQVPRSTGAEGTGPGGGSRTAHSGNPPPPRRSGRTAAPESCLARPGDYGRPHYSPGGKGRWDLPLNQSPLPEAPFPPVPRSSGHPAPVSVLSRPPLPFPREPIPPSQTCQPKGRCSPPPTATFPASLSRLLLPWFIFRCPFKACGPPQVGLWGGDWITEA